MIKIILKKYIKMFKNGKMFKKIYIKMLKKMIKMFKNVKKYIKMFKNVKKNI